MPTSRIESAVAQKLPELFARRAHLSLQPTPIRVSRVSTRYVPDLIYRLNFDGRTAELWIEVKGRFDQESVQKLKQVNQKHPSKIPLLVLPRLTRQAREYLRDAQINHADLTGTIYLRAPGIRIDLAGHGRPPRISEEQKINPFSKRASKVLRVLLSASREDFGIIALARQAHVTKGWCSSVARELVRRGYAVDRDGRIRLGDSTSILKDWILHYDWTNNKRRSWVIPHDLEEFEDLLPKTFKGLHWAYTLLAGADLLARHARPSGRVQVYFRSDDFEEGIERIRHSLFGEPSPRGGNLDVFLPYHGDSVFYDERVVGRLRAVSPVQLFLDLAKYPVRGPEAASLILRKTLASELNWRKDQISALLRVLNE